MEENKKVMCPLTDELETSIRKIIFHSVNNKDVPPFKITIEGLSAAAGNHLFDDKPELFELTQVEGHKIREYFQQGTEKQFHEELDSILETKEEREEHIYKKIKEIYSSEKGKGFITHLLRSFLPVYKSTFVMFPPEKDGKEVEMKCCITGNPLISKMEVAGMVMSEEHREEMSKNFMKTIRAGLDDKPTYVESPLRKQLKGKVFAIGCEKSDKFLCQESLDGLLSFFTNEMLCGNKDMEWLGKNMRAKESISTFKEKGIINRDDEKVIMKNVNKPAKVTLGDISKLAEIKKKLEEEEKKQKEE